MIERSGFAAKSIGWTAAFGAVSLVAGSLAASAFADEKRLEAAAQSRSALQAQGSEAQPTEAGGAVDRRPSAGTPSLAERLAEWLRAQGWQAEVQGDGSLIYRRAEVSQAPLAERQLADQLREQLEKQGWEAYPADNGGVIYRRPDAEQASFAERLRAQLEQQGWEVESNEDGSLIFRRPAVVKPAPKEPLEDPQGGLLEWRNSRGGARLFAGESGAGRGIDGTVG